MPPHPAGSLGHHAPREWADKYRGKFDSGWDRYRQETLARQSRLGVVPPETRLAPKPKAIRDWDTLTPDERRLFARQMEAFAGFAEHTDHEIGRLIKTIEELGAADNTVFIYIAGDNGSSAEGSMQGMFNEMSFFNAVPETVDDQLKHLDTWGGPETFPHYAVGWAIAGNTPFSYAKQVASNFGGTAAGMVIRWPKRVRAKGEVRGQFHHVVDIAPTILEVAGVPMPKSVNGTVQKPMEGVSLAYTFGDATAKGVTSPNISRPPATAPSTRTGGSPARCTGAPWEAKPRASLDKDTWELYDTRSDFSLSNDLTAKHPKKLAEMQARFLKEAAKYTVLPIDDRSLERLDAKAVGRPDLMGGRTSLTLYEA